MPWLPTGFLEIAGNPTQTRSAARSERAAVRHTAVRYPVALTRAVWERCVAVPPSVVCQDEAGRLWDIV
jgi:hypothetical protein